MKQANAFSELASGAIARVRELAQLGDKQLPDSVKGLALSEIKFHETTIREAFSFRQEYGPSLGAADSDSYFSEKLVGMISFATMSIDHSQRGGYSFSKIIENVDHYSYLVSRLVAAEWFGRSRRPATEKAIKGASYENEDALKRLANR